MIAPANNPHCLAEALATRLCHDLSSPLSTLLGVADVVADDQASPPDTLREALALMAEAGQALAHRVRMCRAAWGSAVPLGVAEFIELAQSLTSKRLDIDLSHFEQTEDLPAEAARLTLNLLLLAAESLPRGGVIGLQGSSRHGFVVQIDGPNAAWPTGLLRLLAEPDLAWQQLDNPAALQGPLTVLLAASSGMRISVLLAAGGGKVPPLRLELPAVVGVF